MCSWNWFLKTDVGGCTLIWIVNKPAALSSKSWMITCLNIKRYLMKVKAVAELEWWWSKPVWDCKGAAAGRTDRPKSLQFALHAQHRSLQCTDAQMYINTICTLNIWANWMYVNFHVECMSVQSTNCTTNFEFAVEVVWTSLASFFVNTASAVECTL